MTDPAAIARQFAFLGEILSVDEYGSGNVNDTYLVRVAGGQGIRDFILQRLSPTVFPRPEQIMHNLRVLDNHVRPKLLASPNQRWELPSIVPSLSGADYCRDDDGAVWRTQTFIADTQTFDAITSEAQAEEAGRALGFFHALIHDLPAHLLHDTLPGFHVTPGYLAHYAAVAPSPPRPDSSPEALFCHQFIDERKEAGEVLEAARARGELHSCPIHGDPKLTNILFSRDTGQAISLIDLDTVKPGLLHYDIGDCLRSCCNAAGEDVPLAEVSFNLAYCAAILRGYLPQVAPFFSVADYRYLYDAVRLITFELGLRFFSDHLAGDVYFRIRRPGQNLHRAMVQFALCQSIEAQEREIKKIVAECGKHA
ncbi:MAG: aminoglycoside phosphotransferase family protein [Deltaproteobacteria bacterium]|nr:aminoglycoside phosphotransferase family protein [Deltaproteobacteria bacterium]